MTGTRARVDVVPRTCPPASQPCAIKTSAPASSALLASSSLARGQELCSCCAHELHVRRWIAPEQVDHARPGIQRYTGMFVLVQVSPYVHRERPAGQRGEFADKTRRNVWCVCPNGHGSECPSVAHGAGKLRPPTSSNGRLNEWMPDQELVCQSCLHMPPLLSMSI
jgi:hypothetical protein